MRSFSWPNSNPGVCPRHERWATCVTPFLCVHNLSVVQPIGYGKKESKRLDLTFATLADPTRRAILACLASGEASVKELAEPFEMTRAAISKHLKVLERAGLISRGRDAQRRPARIEAKPLAEVADYIERYRRFWEEGFKRLDKYLKELQRPEQEQEKEDADGAGG